MCQGHAIACSLDIVTHVSALDLELVVNARCEVVQHDHLTVGCETVLLLDADANQRFDRRRARDAAHARRTNRLLVQLAWDYRAKCG